MCMYKCEPKSQTMIGRIIDVGDETISIRLLETYHYKKGQFVIISIPQHRMTARGKNIRVASIVACGTINSVNDNVLVIESNRINPLISNVTIKDYQNIQCEMIIEKVT